MDKIEEFLKSKNYEDAIRLILTQNIETKRNFNNEIIKLKTEILEQNKRIRYLEQENQKLVFEKNEACVNKYSEQILKSINEGNFQKFVSLINNFPINEYLKENNKPKAAILHHCVKRNLLEFSQFVVNKKANINLLDLEENWPPLMYSIQNNNHHMSKFLLENGANVNYKDQDGFTPLSVAIDTANIKIVSLILDYKPYIEDVNSLMEIATYSSNPEMTSMVKNYVSSNKQY